jgi:dihydropteroate synthase
LRQRLGANQAEKIGSAIEKRRRIWYAFSVGPFRRALEDRYCGFGTAVIGVLNATPDSFYDGGRYAGAETIARVGELAAAGAFVIDIGGESTRPGAAGVSAKEQLERIEPAVKSAVSRASLEGGLWVSVDTADPSVAETVLAWGVHIINDVTCLSEPDLARVVARANASLLLMHARGKMAQMQGFSEYPDDGYRDVVLDTMREWSGARDVAVACGMPPEDILFDPGIGFAKNARQSMDVLRRLEQFAALSVPIVVGPSRKSFLNLVQPGTPQQRLGATIAACLYAADNGAMMVRVHDVEIIQQALLAHMTIRNSGMRNAADVVSNARSSATEGTCSTAS